jgi:DNA polymerase III alpha subunit (gram-positive type)
VKPKDIKEKNLAFIDIETTGLNPLKHEIIEIACILVEGKSLKVLREISMKVSPHDMEGADQKALRLTGYSKKKWKDAVSLRQALNGLNNVAKNAMLVGWNISFDWSFLVRDFESLGIKYKFDYHRIDAMSMAYAKQDKLRYVGHLRLSKIASLLGFRNWKKHSAMGDTRITYEVFKKLMEI